MTQRTAAPRPRPERTSVARNPKAAHDFFILETFEAGIVLRGTEVKSLRAGKASIKEAWATVRNGEVWLEGMHITPYEQGNRWNHEPIRSRKLLLHRKEIDRLMGGVAQARALGMRTILLVTGKSRPVAAADRGASRGVIRAKVLDWLAASSHHTAIAAVRRAHQRHGGDGALYIVLKRER